MNNKILIILGMHRSGTSLITQWLYKCGLQIGDRLLEANIGNIEGHFEDQDFLELHEEVLKFNHLSAVGLIDNKSRIEINSKYQERFKTLIITKNNLHKEWGWKEPRTCLFLDCYRSLLRNAKYLIILRDCNTVVNSLIKREFKSYERKKLDKWGKMKKFTWNLYRRKRRLKDFFNKFSTHYTSVWINYNEQLLQHIQNIDINDFILINYQMLIDDADKIFKYLNEKWSFELQPVEFRSIYKDSLISATEDIKKYIKDDSLLLKAKQLEVKLSSYQFSQSDPSYS